jgi:hypothetical protein
MKRVSVVFLVAMAIATMASAQATRTWVSGVGDDANPCSRTAPCKTFAGAISKTASPGIINCLDPAGYGAVTITKSITIDCGYTMGSILASGTQGVVINALTTDNIVLRGIDINGAGTTLGTNGINIIQAGSVHVFSCNIASFSTNAIRMTNTSNAIPVLVADSQILNITGTGILVTPTAPGTDQLDVWRTSISKCGGQGIDVAGTSNSATVSNSRIDRNAGAGFQVQQTSSTGAVESTTIANNGTGVMAGVAANTPPVRLSRTFITGNTTNGVVGSTTCFSNNVINGNTGSNACGTPNVAQQ